MEIDLGQENKRSIIQNEDQPVLAAKQADDAGVECSDGTAASGMVAVNGMDESGIIAAWSGERDGEKCSEDCEVLSQRVRDIIEGKLAFDRETEEILWATLKKFDSRTYYTSKKLEYKYKIRGNEMFVSRKEKSITRSTVVLAFKKALEIQQGGEIVKGPKKLGTFGASYLYPIFQTLKIL